MRRGFPLLGTSSAPSRASMGSSVVSVSISPALRTSMLSTTNARKRSAGPLIRPSNCKPLSVLPSKLGRRPPQQLHRHACPAASDAGAATPGMRMPEQQPSAAEASFGERQSKSPPVLDLLHQLQERFPWLPSSQDILRLWLPSLALCALTSIFDGKGLAYMVACICGSSCAALAAIVSANMLAARHIPQKLREVLMYCSMAGLFLLYREPAMSRVALISKWMHLTIGVPTSLYRAINSPAAAPLLARMYTLARWVWKILLARAALKSYGNFKLHLAACEKNAARDKATNALIKAARKKEAADSGSESKAEPDEKALTASNSPGAGAEVRERLADPEEPPTLLPRHLQGVPASWADKLARDQALSVALFKALGEGDIELVEQLLMHGANPNARNKATVSALAIACLGNSSDAVRLLLEAGADADGSTSLESDWIYGHYFTIEAPLMIAARRDKREVAELLLKHGANARCIAPETDWTPLLTAASAGSEATLQLLLAHVAEPNACSKIGRTALGVACLGGNSSCVRLLLEAGADVAMNCMVLYARDGYVERTPLQIAAKAGRPQVVEILLAAGADFDGRPEEYSDDPKVLDILKGHQSRLREGLNAEELTTRIAEIEILPEAASGSDESEDESEDEDLSEDVSADSLAAPESPEGAKASDSLAQAERSPETSPEADSTSDKSGDEEHLIEAELSDDYTAAADSLSTDDSLECTSTADDSMAQAEKPDCAEAADSVAEAERPGSSSPAKSTGEVYVEALFAAGKRDAGNEAAQLTEQPQEAAMPAEAEPAGQNTLEARMLYVQQQINRWEAEATQIKEDMLRHHWTSEGYEQWANANLLLTSARAEIEALKASAQSSIASQAGHAEDTGSIGRSSAAAMDGPAEEGDRFDVAVEVVHMKRGEPRGAWDTMWHRAVDDSDVPILWE